MRLTKLQLTNYRAFEDVSVELPSEGLVLIAGQNNAGKSALLSAIDLLAGRDPRLPAQHHESREPALVVGEFEISELDRAAAFGHSEHIAAWIASPVLRHVRWTLTQLYEQQFFWSSVATENLAGVMEEFGRATAEQGYNGSVLDLRTVFSNPTFQVEPTWSSYTSRTQSAGESFLQSHPRDLRPAFDRWRKTAFHFDAIRTGTPRNTPISNVAPTLQPDGANLAECLLYHFSQDSRAWHAITAAMSSVLPDVGDLVIPVSGNTISIAFVDPNSQQRRNLKDLGSGVEQLLMTVYVGETQPADSISLVEEPETSLHPAAQRELLRHLLRFSQQRLVVATTHSSVFLDGRQAKAGQTLLVRRSRGRSEVIDASDGLTDAMDEIGVRLSDVLSAERVLLVEGESDAEILRTWFPKQLLSRSTATVALGGSDRGYHLSTVREVLNGADALGRELLFLRDRDELGPRRLAPLEQDPRIAVLTRRELENYFLDDPIAITRVLDARRVTSGSAEDKLEGHVIARALRAAADELRSVVVLKRLAEDYIPPRLLGRKDIQQLAVAGPSVEAVAEALGTSIDGAREVLARLQDLWLMIESELSEVWDDQWQVLVPGSDLLAAIWRQHGLRYDKKRDGIELARSMSTPPLELQEIIAGFVG